MPFNYVGVVNIFSEKFFAFFLMRLNKTRNVLEYVTHIEEEQNILLEKNFKSNNK